MLTVTHVKQSIFELQIFGSSSEQAAMGLMHRDVLRLAVALEGRKFTQSTSLLLILVTYFGDVI